MSPDDDDRSVSSNHSATTASGPMDLSLKMTTVADTTTNTVQQGGRRVSYCYPTPYLTEPVSRPEPLSDRNRNLLLLRDVLGGSAYKRGSAVSPNRQDALDLTISS